MTGHHQMFETFYTYTRNWILNCKRIQFWEKANQLFQNVKNHKITLKNAFFEIPITFSQPWQEHLSQNFRDHQSYGFRHKNQCYDEMHCNAIVENHVHRCHFLAKHVQSNLYLPCLYLSYPSFYRCLFFSPKYRVYVRTNVDSNSIFRAPLYTVLFCLPPALEAR